MYFYIRFFILFAFMLVIGPVYSSPSVVLSTESMLVKGQAPRVETGSTIPLLTDYIIVGSSLNTRATASDPDGDSVSILYSWYADDQRVSVSTSYTPSVSDKRKKLKLILTPKTDPNITEPSVGNDYRVGTWDVLYRDPKFIVPSVVSSRFLDFDRAKLWCDGNGARVPSISELREFLVDATSLYGDYNYTTRMCTLFNIPIQNMCQGIVSDYWAINPAQPSVPVKLDFTNRNQSNGDPKSQSQVICIR